MTVRYCHLSLLVTKLVIANRNSTIYYNSVKERKNVGKIAVRNVAKCENLANFVYLNKICKLHRDIFFAFYNILQPNFAVLPMLFE